MKTPLQSTEEIKLYFSLVSGEIYTVMADEVKNLDKYQIPLLSRPKNCKKCYGRMHVGFNKTIKVYQLCQRCVDHHVDFKQLKTPDIDIETVKNVV